MNSEPRIRLRPGFVVTVRDADGGLPDLSQATDAVVYLQRPDSSLVERRANPVGGAHLEVALHSDDLCLPGDYLGEVRCTMGGEPASFSPAFRLRLGGVAEA